ncbi:DUF3558 family protein [Nocardia sp. XZ_19_385]|uniref:DUF3558 family protein n=1 Tax=Nocardia sp. XZ_19_385 TaxID=2769488 RepID=UPI0018906062|nr:DUF3558 family protein [Nocardia sp. XZ_19_385]
MQFRARGREFTLLALAVGVVWTAACSISETQVGRAHFAQHKSLGVAELWDPCVGIPENILHDAGFDPETKDNQAESAKGKGDKGCRWRGGHGELNAFSHTLPLRQLADTAGFLSGSEPVTIDDRAATETRDPARNTCGVGFDTTEGTVFLEVTNHSPLTVDDSCAQVAELARRLHVHLPAY